MSPLLHREIEKGGSEEANSGIATQAVAARGWQKPIPKAVPKKRPLQPREERDVAHAKKSHRAPDMECDQRDLVWKPLPKKRPRQRLEQGYNDWHDWHDWHDWR